MRAEVSALLVDAFRVLVGLLSFACCARQVVEIDLYWSGNGLLPHATSRTVFPFTWQRLFLQDRLT